MFFKTIFTFAFQWNSFNTVPNAFHLPLIALPFTRFLDLTSVDPFVGSSTCYKVETDGLEEISQDESEEDVEREEEENLTR